MKFNGLSLIYFLIFFNIASYYQLEESKIYVKDRDIQSYNFINYDGEFLEKLLNEFGSSLKITSLFYKSNRNNDYENSFSINKNCETKISGDKVINKINSRDLRAEYFSLDQTSDFSFSSKIKQESLGLILDFKTTLKNFINFEIFSKFIFGFKTVINRKKNELQVDTKNKSDEQKLINFFKNESKFSKITNNEQKDLNFESFIFTLGSFYKSKNEKLNIYYFSGVEIPSTKKDFYFDLFSPEIGNNGHLGLQMGAHVSYKIKDCENFNFGIYSAIENHFRFYRTHYLTFDLKGKPWSRYLPVINSKDFNEKKYLNEISTLPARTHPCNNLDLTLALFFKTSTKNSVIDFAAGYNAWFSQKEYIELMDREHQKIYKNFLSHGIKGTDYGKTSSTSDISNLKTDDYKLSSANSDFVKFKISDLDLGSVNKEGGYSQSIFFKINIEGDSFTGSLGAWKEIGNERIQSRTGGFFGIGYKW